MYLFTGKIDKKYKIDGSKLDQDHLTIEEEPSIIKEEEEELVLIKPQESTPSPYNKEVSFSSEKRITKKDSLPLSSTTTIREESEISPSTSLVIPTISASVSSESAAVPPPLSPISHYNYHHPHLQHHQPHSRRRSFSTSPSSSCILLPVLEPSIQVTEDIELKQQHHQRGDRDESTTTSRSTQSLSSDSVTIPVEESTS